MIKHVFIFSISVSTARSACASSGPGFGDMRPIVPAMQHPRQSVLVYGGDV
jgi:hypothetical protein